MPVPNAQIDIGGIDPVALRLAEGVAAGRERTRNRSYTTRANAMLASGRTVEEAQAFIDKQRTDWDLAHSGFLSRIGRNLAPGNLSQFELTQQSQRKEGRQEVIKIAAEGRQEVRDVAKEGRAETAFGRRQVTQFEGFKDEQEVLDAFRQEKEIRDQKAAGVQRGIKEEATIRQEGRAEDTQIRKEERDPLSTDEIKAEVIRRMQAGEEVPGFEGLTPPDVLKLGGTEITNILSNASPAERKALAETEATIDQLDNMLRLFPDVQTGPIIGPVLDFLGKFGWTSEQQENFRAATASFRSMMIQAITGAAVGVTEQVRIESQIPLMSDSPTRWKAKYKQSKLELVNLQRRRRESLAEAGRSAPKFSGTSAPADEKAAMEALEAEFGMTPEQIQKEMQGNITGTGDLKQ